MRLLWYFLRLLGWFVRLPISLLRRARRAPRGAWLHLELDGAVDDVVPPPPRFWEIWSRGRKRPLSLQALRRALDQACEDPRVRGLLVTVRSFHGGMASASSLRAVFASVRARGKELAVHLPLGADTREVLLATAASRVLVGPCATVAPLGFAARARYLKAALDKAGVEPQVFARGAYKSAGELLVREEMSDAQREQTDRILDGLYETLLAALCERPGVDRARAQALIDGGPYQGDEAVAAGLCDTVAYDDEVADRLGADGERAHLVPLAEYLSALRATRPPERGRGPAIAVIRAHGAITGGEPRGPFGRASEEALVSAIRAARKSRRARAVILHVNSPGGSALASDRIHHELEQLAKEKPLVAYLSDVAASGGYYLAAAAHEIVAQPTTVTGSIGVVAARFSAEGLLHKLGVRSESLQRGARAHLVDPLAPLGDGDRAALERELDGVYRAFLEVVARGRKRSLEEVRAVAEGRVWTGADAKERGLVDKLGGFEVALEAARARLGEKGKGLKPALLMGGRHAGPPLDPPQPQQARAWLLSLLSGALGTPLPELFAHPRERALLFSDLAARLAGDPDVG